MMKVLLLDSAHNLSITDHLMPIVDDGHVIVKIKASALNHRELWIQKGLYPGMTLPCILGADGAGTVVETMDTDQSEWLHRDVIIYPGYDWGKSEDAPSRRFRVLGMPDPGTIAEYLRVPVSHLVLKPPYLTFNEAAAIPVAGLTSWRALVRHGKINHQSKVLITGIGGGVAQAGLSIAKAYGASVYVTSSSQAKIDHAVSHGAEGGVNYREKDWNLQLKSLSGGIDIVLDSSPSPQLDDYFRFLNYGGRVVTYGSTGAPQTTISISKFFLRHIQFIGTAMGSPAEFRELITFMDTHQIRPHIHSVYPFDQALEAIELLKSGKQIGKIVINHE